ncbi:MerR family transcriptional regulator [Clostridium ihumii]|uniref:MerR family transcriptional regulator n=1 Tax=Clostridium ihumii TaxID=1470356 RepID=UPI0005905581|nr:MerR family transcriptional regulator [Clostridium ihumii]
MRDEFYSIGKVGEICKITTKALRYYDKMGILSPDKIAHESGYRYYSKENLLTVPMIKYYKQSGFKLEEMKEFLNGTTYDFFDKRFRNKIDELSEMEKEINLKKRSLKDWHNLIAEAQMILENNACDVSVKYVENKILTFLEQDFNYDYMDSIINLEFSNYIDNMKNAVTGPVMICFPSVEEKIAGRCKKVRIMQETILKSSEEVSMEFGGWMAVSCYHIGSHETIDETYNKIKEWANSHNYICSDECYERYVTDYWTTKNKERFVTEILIKIKRKK